MFSLKFFYINEHGRDAYDAVSCERYTVTPISRDTSLVAIYRRLCPSDNIDLKADAEYVVGGVKKTGGKVYNACYIESDIGKTINIVRT